MGIVVPKEGIEMLNDWDGPRKQEFKMQPYQERVITEQTELQDKIDKLYKFTTIDLYKGLDKLEQDRLSEQLGYMIDYNRVLLERITAFKEVAE